VSDYDVILVCMGNICRSPMAEIVLRQQLAEAGLARRVTVSSAGTGNWHVGQPADPRAQLALSSGGYPTKHAARQFDPTWFSTASLIVALDSENLRDLRHLAPSPAVAQSVRLLRSFDAQAVGVDVADPYYGDASAFDQTLESIEQACLGIVAHIKSDLERRN